LEESRDLARRRYGSGTMPIQCMRNSLSNQLRQAGAAAEKWKILSRDFVAADNERCPFRPHGLSPGMWVDC